MKHFTTVMTSASANRTVHVDIAIDLEGLYVSLGHKALKNKTKKTKALHGLISCEVRPVTTEK